jgi:hypothetical protein|eukprot:COSAG06_NODE_79_length_25437_cov_12.062673_29_plen_62_part_00
MRCTMARASGGGGGSRWAPVMGRGVAVAVVDEQGIVVDAVLQGVAASGVNIVWQVAHRALD